MDTDFSSVGRAVFCGDIHGSSRHFDWVAQQAVWSDASLLVACGDFGFWPHMSWGQDFLDHVDTLCEMTGLRVLWVDGNHENHDWLDDLVGVHGDGEPVPTGRFHAWLPRGAVTQVGELMVMGYGGAWSVDWRRRELGVSWWEQETIDPVHVDGLPSGRRVDVLVTHEAPLCADRGVLSYKDDYWDSVAQRRLITDVVSVAEPSLVFCGHHHTRASFRAAVPCHPVVNVLGRDSMGDDSIFVMDATLDEVEAVREEFELSFREDLQEKC